MNLATQLKHQITEAYFKIDKSFEQYMREGSGWTLDQITKLQVRIAPYSPLVGTSYMPLSKKLQAKKDFLNIQNTDECCFKWSVLAALHHVSKKDHANRVSHYTQYDNELDWSMLDFPTPMSQIPAFEKANQISINVIAYEKGETFPLQVSEAHFHVNVDLLLFSEREKRHYCLVRNFSRPLGYRTKHRCRAFYCHHCLQGFTSDDILQAHTPYCSTHAPQKVVLPDEEK
jgi:hypothetical protein